MKIYPIAIIILTVFLAACQEAVVEEDSTTDTDNTDQITDDTASDTIPEDTTPEDSTNPPRLPDGSGEIDMGPDPIQDTEGNTVCCKSFGYGAMMVECCQEYEWTKIDECTVPEDYVGGGKTIVDAAKCEGKICCEFWSSQRPYPEGASHLWTTPEECVQPSEAGGGSIMVVADENCATQLKFCPDEWYDNQMPGPSSSEDLPNQYFVVNSERRELADFDTDWVTQNCDLEKQVVV